MNYNQLYESIYLKKLWILNFRIEPIMVVNVKEMTMHYPLLTE